MDASVFLSIRAEVDRAQMIALNTRFQYQIAAATLLNTMGKSPCLPGVFE